ncbi:post-transcriptional regulator [Brockia lithotrophica]|uniref:ComN-like post-transcriptional regulator n=1 Tax=Brockia lithotrophica TaxID=933949 RepID=A0A660L860_9BACL|nr:post-transcriptional regulator [Brockia lithotrophica]RKQ89049.1 ComN-like post-transcriptional regulator [Brockia lithotrophica]
MRGVSEDPYPKFDREVLEGSSSPQEDLSFPNADEFDIEAALEALRVRDGYGVREAPSADAAWRIDRDVRERYGEEIRTSLLELCEARAADFRLLGLAGVTGEDVWRTVLRRYDDVPPLYRLVADILSLKVQTFLDDRRREMYRNLR